MKLLLCVAAGSLELGVGMRVAREDHEGFAAVGNEGNAALLD